MKPQDAWRATQGQLRVQLHHATYETWVRDCEFVDYRNGVFTLSVRNAYIKDWLENRLYRSVRHALSGIFRQVVEIDFVVTSPSNTQLPTPQIEEDPPLWPSIPPPPPPPANQSYQQQSLEDDGFYTEDKLEPDWDTCLNPNYHFANFIVGDSNHMAHAAAQAVSLSPTQAYNPLLFFGGSGLGKTHLLHAIGHKLTETGYRVLYTTAEQFTNQLVEAIRRKQTLAFRDTYRTVDVLLVDDVQFLANKTQIQEEFFHTFNALHSQGKQIILASDRHPEEIDTLSERLRSRFVWGLMAHIDPPELMTRLAILSDKAEVQGHYLPLEIAHLIAERIEGNVRELEGILTQVLAYATLMGKGLTFEVAERILRQKSGPRDQATIQRRLSVADILQTTAQFYQLNLSDLVGKSRHADITNVRHLAIYLAREETGASLAEIGNALGRNHSTVLYSYNKIADQIDTDAELRQNIQRLRERLYSNAS